MVVELPNGEIHTILDKALCQRICKELLGDDLYECLMGFMNEEWINFDCEAIEKIEDTIDNIRLFSTSKEEVICSLQSLMSYFENR